MTGITKGIPEVITEVIDGDTLYTPDAKVRVSNINTPESVHRNPELNTPEGDVASGFAKDVLPVGATITKHSYGSDHFGREVASVTRNINGVEVDYGLVALDQEMSAYYTEYGEHRDPLLHNQYQEYYSKHVPYQFGSSQEPLSREQFDSITAKQDNFTNVYSAFKEGTATQEEFDTATADLYGNPDEVMRYRHQLSDWNRPLDQESDTTLRGAMRLAMENDPELKAQYNRAVRNGHLMTSPIPESDPTFFQKIDMAFSSFNSISNGIDHLALYKARATTTELEVPEEEILKGVPTQYHAMLLQEANTYNDYAALLLKEQLVDDLENNREFANMDWYAQLGYGILATVADPLLLLPAVPLIKGSQAAIAANRAWQMSRVIGGKGVLKGSDITAKMAAYTALGAVDGTLVNAPRLSGDHTYTAKAYQLDIALNAGFGLVLGGAVQVGKVGLKYSKEVRQARRREVEQIHSLIEGSLHRDAPNPEMQLVQDTIDQARHSEEASQRVSQLVNEPEVVVNTQTTTPPHTQSTTQQTTQPTTQSNPATEPVVTDGSSEGFTPPRNKPFVPFAAVTEVSSEGFKSASSTLVKVFPDKSPMRMLINSQNGLLKKNLSGDELVEVNKLSADILHLAAAFPTGKVPSNVNKAIKGITFNQKTYKQHNPISSILEGTTSDQVGTLQGYIDALRGMTHLWDETAIDRVTTEDFFRSQSKWLNISPRSIEADSGLTATIPKELSYLRDIVELNRLAKDDGNDELIALVEELNGMVTVRLNQLDAGDVINYVAPKDLIAKSVPMTTDEIVAKLKELGIPRLTQKALDRTKVLESQGKTKKQISATLEKEGLNKPSREYSAKMRELRATGRMGVNDQTRQVGNITERHVGEKRTEFDPDVESLRGDTLAVNGRDPSIFPSKERTAKEKDATPDNELPADSPRAELNTADKVLQLYTDDFDHALLPSSYTETIPQKAFKNPTVKTLKELRNRLNHDLLRKLGVKTIKRQVDVPAKLRRLEAIKKALLKDKDQVIERMIAAGKWSNVEDVIRVSHTIANERRLNAAVTKHTADAKGTSTPASTSQPTPPPTPPPKPLTEESIAVVVDGNSGRTIPKVPKEELDETIKTISKANAAMVEASITKVSDQLTKWSGSSAKKAWELAKKPTGILDYTGRVAAKITEDLGTKFHNGKLNSLEFVGAHITEIGKGYGGRMRREPTGGLIRDGVYRKLMSQISPQYFHTMDAYAVHHGKGAVGRLNAQQQAGAQSELVKQFNYEFFTVQEYRRQGRELPASIPKVVVDFVDQFDKFTTISMDHLIDAQIAGFSNKRRVKHYVPHVWVAPNLRNVINKRGADFAEDLLTKGYHSATTRGINPTDTTAARQLAKEQIAWILRQEAAPTDQYSPTIDSRAKARLDIDTTAEIDGISILDLLDTDVISVATKYANRTAGWVGLSDSTKGMLTSDMDIAVLKQTIIQEGIEKGVKTSNYEQYYKDLINLMFGRPTRGGLPPELMDIKDLTALTTMGGLGTSQAIETGAAITRSVISLFSSPKTIAKVFSMARESGETLALLREIESISNINKDMEHLARQATHLDRAELQDIKKMRQLSMWLADKATAGKVKAPASRIMGKVSAYNAVRRIQSRIVQSSFTVDVAKHFRNGTGVMGNKRMADVGLTDTFGKDADLSKVFNSLVEYDATTGLVSKLNFDKWPKAARDKFQYALLRDEAQQLQRTIVGELPPWMNKPLMAMTFQFRQMPIVANNKQLNRSLAFADKEAVTMVMLNAAIAGMVRYSKFAVLGAGAAAITGHDWQQPTTDQMQAHKYIAQLGIYADATDLVLGAYTAGTQDKPTEALLSEVKGQVPAMGLMSDYYNTVGGETLNEQMEAAHGLVPAGNLAAGDMLFEAILETFGD